MAAASTASSSSSSSSVRSSSSYLDMAALPRRARLAAGPELAGLPPAAQGTVRGGQGGKGGGRPGCGAGEHGEHSCQLERDCPGGGAN